MRSMAHYCGKQSPFMSALNTSCGLTGPWNPNTASLSTETKIRHCQVMIMQRRMFRLTTCSRLKCKSEAIETIPTCDLYTECIPVTLPLSFFRAELTGYISHPVVDTVAVLNSGDISNHSDDIPNHSIFQFDTIKNSLRGLR